MTTETTKLPVAGHEQAVRTLRGKMKFLAQLQEEVDAGKKYFRSMLTQLMPQLPRGVKTLEFMDPESGSLLLSLNDETKAGNRNKISAEAMAEFAAKDFPLDKFVETEEVIELRGQYVTWLKQLLPKWKEQGVRLPPAEDLVEKKTTRLSAEGVAALHEYVDAGQSFHDVAAEVLERFIKSAVVNVR